MIDINWLRAHLHGAAELETRFRARAKSLVSTQAVVSHRPSQWDFDGILLARQSKLDIVLLDAIVIELIPVTMTMAEQAAEIAAEHRIRGCDAIYVALANQLRDTLVTLDRQQLERGAAPVTVRAP